MAGLDELQHIKFSLTKCTTIGNIFTGNGKTCLLKPVNREYKGTAKKPLYYLNLLMNGKSTYLSGLFPTGDPSTFSADYRDKVGMKHLVKIRFSEAGKQMTIDA